MESLTKGPRNVTGNRRRKVKAGPPKPSLLLAWVAEQVLLAAQALKADRLTSRDLPRGPRSGMPEVARTRQDVWESQLGMSDAQRHDMAKLINLAFTVSTTEQISALERVMDWMLWLTPEQRIVLLGRAIGISRSKLARKLGKDRTTTWRWEQEALRTIAAKLGDKLVTNAVRKGAVPVRVLPPPAAPAPPPMLVAPRAGPSRHSGTLRLKK